MSGINEELGVENAALAKTLEGIMAKYFKEADEKSEARSNRLEKRLDNMHATLFHHTEDIKTLRSDATQLEQCVSQTEARMQTLSDKIVEMEDRARRDNLLVFNLKGGVEGSNMLSYLAENIPRWFPVFTSANPKMMRAHRLGGPQRTASAQSSSNSCATPTEISC